MEKYKNTLKQRILFLGIFDLLFTSFLIFHRFFAPEHWKSIPINEFQCGLMAAGILLTTIIIIRYRRILDNETKLRLQYNMEYDERLRMIRARAGFPILFYCSIAMLILAVIWGYMNLTVFYVLTAVAVLQLLTCCIAKLVYFRIM